MIDGFVLLTPLVLLPVFALLAFVGCQFITGVDEYEAGAPPGPVTFSYSDLPDDVVGIGWEFVTSTLTYPSGETVPAELDPGPHVRGRPGEPPLLDQEVVEHGSIGEPSGGTLSCRAFVLRSGEQQPEVVTPTGKRPDQPGFPQFHLTGDPTPELV